MSYSDKTILLTGASGFLGNYIHAELKSQGFNIITLGRKKGDLLYNLAHEIPKLVANIDYVVHAAGKAHIVPKTFEESNLFFEINFNGTRRLLEGLSHSKSKINSIIFISTVAVYGLSEGNNINEETERKASDPYGKSKILAEDKVIDFCRLNNFHASILRLPLIAGNNPPGNLGSMIKAIRKGWYFSIGEAESRKSIVLADDVAKLIPQLFGKSGIYNLTDGCNPSFAELESAIAIHFTKRKPLKIPQIMANLMAKTGDIFGKKSPINSSKLKKIQSTLTFSDEKARKELNWNPHSVVEYYLSSPKFQVPNPEFQKEK